MTATWTTKGLTETQALKEWGDVVRARLTALDVGTPVSDFYATLEQAPLDALRLSHITAAPQVVRRARTDQTGLAMFDLIHMRKGSIAYQGSDGEFVLHEGDCMLIDQGTAYRFDSAHVTTLVLGMPRTWLRRWIDEPERVCGRRIDGRHGWGAALSAMIDQLDVGTIGDLALAECAVADQIAGLLVLGTQDRADRLSPCDRLRARARDIVRSCAHDPDLTPERAAAELGISKRYFHALFAGMGTSFGRELLEERLTRARALLADPRSAKLQIGEIAWRCGFQDQGHFAKRFRTRFGFSPSAARSTLHS